jgi:hypothetical protein
MRTTLSLDDDVAKQLEAWRKKEDLGLKEAVNAALRRGLAHLNAPAVRKPFSTKAVDMGECFYPSLDNVWEVIEDAERER